jgi:hypothetical protein
MQSFTTAPEMLCAIAIAMAIECVQSRAIKKFYTWTHHSKPSADLVHTYYELWGWILKRKSRVYCVFGVQQDFFQKEIEK